MVVAHAGGAPEAAVIGLPLLIFAGFMVAERRARMREQAQEKARETEGGREDGPASRT